MDPGAYDNTTGRAVRSWTEPPIQSRAGARTALSGISDDQRAVTSGRTHSQGRARSAGSSLLTSEAFVERLMLDTETISL